MKMDKYEAVNPVVEQATLESRLESRCEESYRQPAGGIATELVPLVAAQDKREFRQFELAYKRELRRQSSVDSFKASKPISKQKKNERLVELYAMDLKGAGPFNHRKRPSRSTTVTHRRATSARSLSAWSQKSKTKKRAKSVNRSTRSRSRAKSYKSNNKSTRSYGRVRSKSRKDEIGEDGMSAALRKAIRGVSTHR